MAIASAATAAAVAVPPLLAWNLPPSSTFFNQIAALALWGLAIAAAAPRFDAAVVRRAAPVLAVLAAIALLALAAWVAGPLPSGLALTPAFALAAAAVALLAGAASGPRGPMLRGLLWGLVVVGAASALVAFVQVFAPAWADGTLIARATLNGRATGNLRQPNHSSTLMLWSAIALVALVALVPRVDATRSWRTAAFAVFALLMVAVELTGSRTGALGVAVLALWGAIDDRLGRTARRLLIGAPVLYAIAWGGVWVAAQLGAAPVGTLTRAAEGDLSNSRFAVWSNALSLVAVQPWTGVGFGRFNFAWTLTPFPDRPVAFFDHVHNLPLQFAVEFGVPLALLLTALVALALLRAARLAAAGDAARRALFAMLLLVGVHSLLEYPLWYLHFLLPACWAFGAVLAGEPAAAGAPARGRPLAVAGVAMLLAAGVATADYLRVARIFTPRPGAAPLAQRIADGQRSPWFGHHADYAAATAAAAAAAPAHERLAAIDRAAYHLLDTRLMIAWARALDEAGDAERARHLAQRLREFRRPESRELFAPCEAAAGAPPPAFPCAPPAAVLDWRDFVR